MNLSNQKQKPFSSIIWDYYQAHRRDFSWRNTTNPYHIVVSEVMLQQTQTHRVKPKYEAFIQAFPSFAALANASLHDVLTQWQGLGYNRRGMYLHQLAQIIIDEHNGILPESPEQLVKLPGIGKATAASICAFAFNMPTVFIETNIRTVFIHFFFQNKDSVDDSELLPLIAKTVNRTNPRQWYYALMDYGVMLKKKHPNPSRKSKHHTTQSKFEGSDRQIRGQILKILTEQKKACKSDLFTIIAKNENRMATILQKMISEGLIQNKNDVIIIS